MHGAELELVPGPRQATADEAVRQSGERFYASHNWHPFFLQGTKLIAYEIWEQLGFTRAGRGADADRRREPRARLLDRLQRAAARRARSTGSRACSSSSPSTAARWRGRSRRATTPSCRRDWQPTIAEGTSIARPVRDREVLAAVRESGGMIVAVAEEAIAPAVRTLAAHGLYAEPTSALVVAALPRASPAGRSPKARRWWRR